MDKHVLIKILSDIEDRDVFLKFIESTKLSNTDLKHEISRILTNRFMKDKSIPDALYELLYPTKRYVLLSSKKYEQTKIRLTGTKEEIIDYMVNDAYVYIGSDFDYSNVSKEDVQKYYEDNFVTNNLLKLTSNDGTEYYLWDDNSNIISYIGFYKDDNNDFYSIYNTDDIETYNKYNKAKF